MRLMPDVNIMLMVKSNEEIIFVTGKKKKRSLDCKHGVLGGRVQQHTCCWCIRGVPRWAVAPPVNLVIQLNLQSFSQYTKLRKTNKISTRCSLLHPNIFFTIFKLMSQKDVNIFDASRNFLRVMVHLDIPTYNMNTNLLLKELNAFILLVVHLIHDHVCIARTLWSKACVRVVWLYCYIVYLLHWKFSYRIQLYIQVR